MSVYNTVLEQANENIDMAAQSLFVLEQDLKEGDPIRTTIYQMRVELDRHAGRLRSIREELPSNWVPK